ncbi:hypothetical protein DOY81_013034 [Sarcophaga bullata]|nr:hypothetical protein DOY81_013034 [Sarcophaga bullata]
MSVEYIDAYKVTTSKLNMKIIQLKMCLCVAAYDKLLNIFFMPLFVCIKKLR